MTESRSAVITCDSGGDDFMKLTLNGRISESFAKDLVRLLKSYNFKVRGVGTRSDLKTLTTLQRVEE